MLRSAKKNKVHRKDVAKKAGVSPSTVSRAINDNLSIPVSTRNRVKKIAEELGYVPSHLGRNYYQKKSFRIGIVMPFSYDKKVRVFPTEYFSKVLFGALLSASREGYTINIIADSGFSSQELEKLVLSHSVDGLIFPVCKIGDNRFSYLYKKGIPFIFIHYYVRNKPYLYVDCDSKPGMEESLQYLSSKKINRIGFLGGDEEYINAIDRKKIFIDLARKYKMKVVNMVNGNFSRTSGFLAVKEFLKKELPEAIVCANDRMAFGLLEGLKKENVRIPEAVRIIGFDNQDIATLTSPPLTTIENPFFEIGKLSTSKLIHFIKGMDVKSERVASKLIIRESA